MMAVQSQVKSNTNNLDVRLIVRSSDYNSGPDPATCTLRVSPALGSIVVVMVGVVVVVVVVVIVVVRVIVLVVDDDVTTALAGARDDKTRQF